PVGRSVQEAPGSAFSVSSSMLSLLCNQRAGLCHEDRLGCRRGAAVNLEGTKCRRGAFALGEAETEEETGADNVEPVPEDRSSCTSRLALPSAGAINASRSSTGANISRCLCISARN